MARRSKTDWARKGKLDELVIKYAEQYDLAYREPSIYHSQLSSGEVLLSLWTGSNKYYIEQFNYLHSGIRDRKGEVGLLPERKKQLYNFLDKLFFAVDLQ